MITDSEPLKNGQILKILIGIEFTSPQPLSKGEGQETIST